MSKRGAWEEQWGRIVSLLERCHRSGLTLAEAQQWFDAAPDLALSPLLIRSVVAQALDRRSVQLQGAGSCSLESLVFSADTLSAVDCGWAEAPRLIGVERDRAGWDAAIVVRSDEIELRRAVLPWSLPALSAAMVDGGSPPTDPVVYDVWPDFRELGRSELHRVSQGTVRSDVYLDGDGLNADQLAIRQELWCDGADHEWENRARNRGH